MEVNKKSPVEGFFCLGKSSCRNDCLRHALESANKRRLFPLNIEI